MYIYFFLYICVYICVCMYMYVFTYMYVCICMYMCVYMCMYIVCIYIFSIFPFWSKMIEMIQNLWAHIWSSIIHVWCLIMYEWSRVYFLSLWKRLRNGVHFPPDDHFFIRPWVFYGFILKIFYNFYGLIIYVLFLRFSYCLLFLNLDHSSYYCTLS